MGTFSELLIEVFRLYGSMDILCDRNILHAYLCDLSEGQFIKEIHLMERLSEKVLSDLHDASGASGLDIAKNRLRYYLVDEELINEVYAESLSESLVNAVRGYRGLKGETARRDTRSTTPGGSPFKKQKPGQSGGSSPFGEQKRNESPFTKIPSGGKSPFEEKKPQEKNGSPFTKQQSGGSSPFGEISKGSKPHFKASDPMPDDPIITKEKLDTAKGITHYPDWVITTAADLIDHRLDQIASLSKWSNKDYLELAVMMKQIRSFLIRRDIRHPNLDPNIVRDESVVKAEIKKNHPIQILLASRDSDVKYSSLSDLDSLYVNSIFVLYFALMKRNNAFLLLERYPAAHVLDAAQKAGTPRVNSEEMFFLPMKRLEMVIEQIQKLYGSK